MKTQDQIIIEISDLYKDEVKKNKSIDEKKLRLSYDWSYSCASIFADKASDAYIYIDDDLNYCFDFVENGRYLSISIESNIYYYAFVYKDKGLKGHGKCDLNKSYDDLLFKQLIKGFFC